MIVLRCELWGTFAFKCWIKISKKKVESEEIREELGHFRLKRC